MHTFRLHILPLSEVEQESLRDKDFLTVTRRLWVDYWEQRSNGVKTLTEMRPVTVQSSSEKELKGHA